MCHITQAQSGSEVKQRKEKEVPLDAKVYTEKKSIFVEGLHFYYSDYCISHRRYSGYWASWLMCKKKNIWSCLCFSCPMQHSCALCCFYCLLVCVICENVQHCLNVTWDEQYPSHLHLVSVFCVCSFYVLPDANITTWGKTEYFDKIFIARNKKSSAAAKGKLKPESHTWMSTIALSWLKWPMSYLENTLYFWKGRCFFIWVICILWFCIKEK